MKRALPLAIILLTGISHAARVDLVTLPQKDRTELTVYNSADLTLVREVRNLSFKKGKNEIQFNWTGVKIDPSSLELVLANDANLTLLDAVYPKGTTDTVIWNIDSPEESSSSITVQYFLSGISWSSSYNVILNADQTKLRLQESTTIRNYSGEDLENAATRVVVGDLNFIETIEQIISRWTPDRQNVAGRLGLFDDEINLNKDKKENYKRQIRMNQDMSFAGAAMEKTMSDAKEIMKKGVSEYQLFSVEGEETILNGWRKQLPNKPVEDVPFDLAYEIDERKFGSVAPQEIIKLKNDTAHLLGKSPLPAGVYYISTRDADNGLRFEGRTDAKYFPVGEDVELNLGPDGLLIYEDVITERKRSDITFNKDGRVTGWNESLTHKLTLKNARDRETPVKLTFIMKNADGESADTEPQSATTPYQKVDSRTLRWEIKIPASSATTIELHYLVRQGSNATS